MTTSRQINIEQLAAEVSAGGQLVDVREPREFADAHVPGAVNIPMTQLPQRSNELDRSRPVLVICRSGNRSSAMTELLLAQGWNAVNVTGGTDAWIRSGRRVESQAVGR